MFKRKCPNCYRKIEKNHRFCPFCGCNLLRRDSEDYGFLGRDDFDDTFESSFNNFPLNRIFQNAMKMLERQMKELHKQEFNQPKESYSNMDIQFFVNGKRVFPEKRTIKSQPVNIEKQLSEKQEKQFAKLPRKEPKTKMKRLSNRLVYELSMPEVKEIDDVLINQLENSIEIKALGKNKVYSKILNVNLPIIKYKLDNGNLVLELQAR